MDLVFWLIGFGITVAAATAFLVLRQRRARRRPGDDDASMHGDRTHSEALAGAHTAGVVKHAH